MPSFFENFLKRFGKSGQTPDREAVSASMARVSMSLVYDEEDLSIFDVSNIPDKELTWTASICPYCGVGCGLLVGSKEGKLYKIRGNPAHPANLGLLCAKGATLAQVVDTPDRLLYPLVRRSQSEDFVRSTWEDSLSLISQKIRETIHQHGPDSVAFYISGQLLTEDYYVINKLAKGFLGTNNVDSNSRLCMASAAAGYTTSLGVDGPPACYEDLELADCFFLIGTNTAACHPVVFQRIKMRKAKDPRNVKVIVADPRRTLTADLADLYLPLRPGTDVALLNGILHVLEKEKLLDEVFIKNSTQGWDELRQLIRECTPEKTASLCGLEARQVVEAARFFGQSKSSLSLWSMGLNQSSSGTAKNNAIINLHLATGKIGKPGSGPFSLTGQPNAMGGRETGGLCHMLPGHRFVADAIHRDEMEKFWKISPGAIGAKPGLSAVELVRAADEGKVKIIWVIATNPVVSIPNGHRVHSALKKAELVIVQDPYHPTETTQLAHVVLPAAQWSERDGTVTNSERRVSYTQKIIAPPGEAKPDWWILTQLARKMGFEKDFPYRSAEEVFEEYKRSTQGTTMDLMGISYARLKEAPLQWPCPSEDAPSTTRLYTDGKFKTADGRARFVSRSYQEPAELTDREYPMILTTGRVRDQWHTMTRTGKVDALLKSEPYAFVELHDEDAASLGVLSGDMVEVVTRRGRARAPARLTERINHGVCFMPFHWGELFGEASVNLATHEAFDPISKQPELKFCACRVELVNERIREFK